MKILAMEQDVPGAMNKDFTAPSLKEPFRS
jgi:hypothetical protein